MVWTLHDQWAFTGGCHYSRGCDHFLTHCNNCPYLRKPGSQDLSYRIFEKKKTLFQNSSIHFTPPSHWLAQAGQQSALLHDAPFTVIPYAIDQTVFCPVDREQATTYLDLADSGNPRILFGSANVTDVRKGFTYFAEALTLLHQQHPDLTPEILVFGKGRSYLLNELPYPVRHLGILTSTDDIVAAYNAADAMVVPSLEDNLPNTVIESLACGTPVVGFRTGGIPEMIDHEENGYLATVGSAQELADGLAFVLTHTNPPSLRQNARHSAETRFSEEVVARQHVTLYNQIVNERMSE
jgi:glycosyltransferase involved in cell wall biosynthesis